MRRADDHGICIECGASFIPSRKERLSTQKLCSRKCAGRNVGKVSSYKYKNAIRNYVCEFCKHRFECYHKNRKFCSRSCFGKYRSKNGSPMLRFYGRTDKNQQEIMNALRNCGASVVDLSSVGRGCPDLLIGYAGKTILMEVKNPKNSYGRKGFNVNQTKWASEWRGQLIIVRSVSEALAAIGAKLM